MLRQSKTESNLLHMVDGAGRPSDIFNHGGGSQQGGIDDGVYGGSQYGGIDVHEMLENNLSRLREIDGIKDRGKFGGPSK